MNSYEIKINRLIWTGDKAIKASSLRVAVNKAFKAFERHHDGKYRINVNIEARLLEKNVQ